MDSAQFEFQGSPGDRALVAAKVYARAAPLLARTRLAYVLPILGAGLRELAKLSCTLEVPATTHIRGYDVWSPCLRVVGPLSSEAQQILERLADAIVTCDPARQTTRASARTLVGLPAISLLQRIRQATGCVFNCR